MQLPLVVIAVLKAYNDAADKFIAKVDRGDARSRETYADLTRARALARRLEEVDQPDPQRPL